MSKENIEEAAEKIHELKIWKEYFDDIDSGKKSFEVRKLDRLFSVGDILWLREWGNISGYTGRETKKRITYFMNGGQWGLLEGNCILGLALWQQSQQSKQIDDYKYLLSNFTDCPQLIIDNPGSLRGKLPTDEDIEWAGKGIEKYGQSQQSVQQQTKDAIDMMRSGLNALRLEVDSTIVDSLVYMFNKVLATQQSISIEENVDRCPTCNAPVKVSWAGLELVENSGDETLATKCYEYIQSIPAPELELSEKAHDKIQEAINHFNRLIHIAQVGSLSAEMNLNDIVLYLQSLNNET